MAIDVSQVLRTALRDLEAQQARLAARITAIRSALNGATAPPSAAARIRRRGMSAAQRAEVSRRMKAYWAKRRAARGRKKKAA
jgi:Arc/MetJ-type ribon-helix-helix transcriptional regulator